MPAIIIGGAAVATIGAAARTYHLKKTESSDKYYKLTFTLGV